MADVVDISLDTAFYRALRFPVEFASRTPAGTVKNSRRCRGAEKLQATLDWCRRENEAGRNIWVRLNGFALFIPHDGGEATVSQWGMAPGFTDWPDTKNKAAPQYEPTRVQVLELPA